MAERQRPRKHWLARLVLCALLLLVAWAAVSSSIVRLEVSQVTLHDLPPAFEGLRIVYLSDLHVHSLNPLSRTQHMLAQLAELQPDLILLGGDYVNYDPLAATRQEGFLQAAQQRDELFAALCDIHPTYGIFAVAGEQDNLLDEQSGASLERTAALGGVTVLRNDAISISRQGQRLWVAGVDDWRSGVQDLTALPESLSSRDCVLLLSHNPDAVPALCAQSASDGGEWIDLALTGHLMGGQIVLFGQALLNPSIYAEEYLCGWYREGDTRLLITRGVGGNLFPPRLGSGAQVHLITLMRG